MVTLCPETCNFCQEKKSFVRKRIVQSGATDLQRDRSDCDFKNKTHKKYLNI